MMKKELAILLSAFFLSACSSLKTTVLNDNLKAGGLTYYLPLSDLQFTIVVGNNLEETAKKAKQHLEKANKLLDEAGKLGDDDKAAISVKLELAKIYRKDYDNYMEIISHEDNKGGAGDGRYHVLDVTVGVSKFYADLDRVFSLRQENNYIAKISSNIGVSPIGLLNSAKIEFPSSITGKNSDDRKENSQETLDYPRYGTASIEDCVENSGTYVVRIKLEEASLGKEKTLCKSNIKFLITRNYDHDNLKRNGPSLGTDMSGPHIGSSSKKKIKGKNKDSYGVFYRQLVPYKVSVSYSGRTKDFIVYSPAGAQDSFLPIRKTLFAENKASLVFRNGILTNYSQETEGELISLFTVPATVLEDYFSAVGNIYAGLSGLDGNKNNRLSSQLELELNRERFSKCINAAKRGNSGVIEELKCSDLISN